MASDPCGDQPLANRPDETLRKETPRGIVRNWTVEEFFAGTVTPTADDAPVAADGRVLDTPDKVIAFVDEVNARRASHSD